MLLSLNLKLNHYSRVALSSTLLILAFLSFQTTTWSQTEDSFGDAAADPFKLFEQGQSAHAKGDFERALDFYERAIQVRPEFPEAEFQRGNALVSLGRLPEAHTAFERAISLRKTWSLPYSALGALLAREGKDRDASPQLQHALELDSGDNLALRTLAEIKLRSGDPKGALLVAQQATRDPQAPVNSWVVRAIAERATGDKAQAKASLEHVLQAQPNSLAALLERAEIWLDEADYEHASADLNQALKQKPGDKQILSRLAFTYERAGKPQEAQRAAESAGLTPARSSSDGTIKVVGSAEDTEAANSNDPAKSRKALEKLLENNPQNAMLLARLGASYRTDDPPRSLDYYRRAASIQPDNGDYASGYAAALVQARRFDEAVVILRRVLTISPQSYIAHANLATALYELKRYDEALPEYQWLLQSKPDLAVAYYFIATAHDYLGEYPEALSAYETFLVRADAKTNQLEIDKVKLRLPSLRRQIQLGEGAKRKKKDNH